MRARIFAVLALLCCAPVTAQQATTAVIPQSITVGDVFHAAVRVQLPANATAQVRDSIPLREALEQAGRSETQYGSANGQRRATVLYPLRAWRAGWDQLAGLCLRIGTGGRARD